MDLKVSKSCLNNLVCGDVGKEFHRYGKSHLDWHIVYLRLETYLRLQNVKQEKEMNVTEMDSW